MNGHELDDQIDSLTARFEEDAVKLRRLKKLRQRAEEYRSQDSKPSPRPVVKPDGATAPVVEPIKQKPELADHERRLQDVE